MEAKNPETIEVPVTIKVRFKGLENGVFADKHAHPDFDLTGVSTNPNGYGYYYAGNDHGDGVESPDPYVPYVTFGPEHDFEKWTVEKGKEYDVHFDLGYYTVDGYNYVSANDVTGATGVDLKFQADNDDPQTLVITLVYEKDAAPTKPEAPDVKGVYDLVGNVDVYCQPGRHQVGHFDTYKTPGRVEIGSVEESNGTYTCEVVFKAQVYCDAYNVLKNTTGDKAHTLVAGEGDETVIFTWNATEETWERPNDFAPVTFYVECPTGGGENPGPDPVIPDKKGLTLTKSVDNSTPALGGTVTYTITVTNSTKVDLKDMLIRDKMPEGLTLVSGSGTVKVGSDETMSIADPAITDGYCDWTVPDIVADKDVVVLTYEATVPASVEGETSLRNVAQAFAKQADSAIGRMIARGVASVANGFVTDPVSTEVKVGEVETPDSYKDGFQSNEDNAAVTVKPDGSGGEEPNPPKDVTYTVVHEYYTNGTLTGSNQDTVDGKVGQTVTAVDITKVTTFEGSSYTYTSADPEILVLVDDVNTITLRYDRTTGGNGGGNGGGTTRYTLTVRYEYEDGTQAAPTYTERLARGDAYSVDSPVIEGYTPDQAVVSGEMPGRSLTVTVVYTPEGQDIPDEEPPLVDLPDEEPPLVNIPEEEPPLVEIPEEEPPLAETPLDPTPKTGDNSRTGLWAALCGFSLFGMLALLGKKREDEEA